MRSPHLRIENGEKTCKCEINVTFSQCFQLAIQGYRLYRSTIQDISLTVNVVHYILDMKYIHK